SIVFTQTNYTNVVITAGYGFLDPGFTETTFRASIKQSENTDSTKFNKCKFYNLNVSPSNGGFIEYQDCSSNYSGLSIGGVSSSFLLSKESKKDNLVSTSPHNFLGDNQFKDVDFIIDSAFGGIFATLDGSLE